MNLFDVKSISKTNTYFTFKFKYVFNQYQVTGYFGDQPDLFSAVSDPDQMIDLLVDKSNANIIVKGDRAFYNPKLDRIFMPNIIRFIHTSEYPAKEKYQSVLLHELIHWTGHIERCNRALIGKFGTKEYAFEELIAELGGAILATHFNQRVFPRKNHSQYLKSWLKVLNNDFSFFTEALELSRFAVFWLLKTTGVHPYEIKEQPERNIKLERLEFWANYWND
jgi:antirestriction protein ArdC